MAELLGTVEGVVKPDRRLVPVLGAGWNGSSFLPEFTSSRVCYADRDFIYLTSISQWHRATVILEAWDSEPPADPEAEVTDTAQLDLSRGQVYVSSSLLEARVSPLLTVGPPGRYVVRVDVRGRSELRRRLESMDWTEDLTDVEQFWVGFWPVST
ncbi:hypothetical protein GA0074695_4740 [Micromonospora viridifaciens]|uniref:Uncharacterized protein n=1 Tax=Micromonospora viridifaciens TaxID=1881 RepID=A0A1C4YVC2_MICVI|nr:hypothetical protein [Micromonospora viridifaciens]SCF24620.1 hypothetical protein GA0074695_4740 [Micromonospora viridifaciens]